MLFRSLATPVVVVLLTALTADRNDKGGVEARSTAFFRRTKHLHQSSSTTVVGSSRSLFTSRAIIDTLPRGGAAPGEDETGHDHDSKEEEDAEAEILYLPGLLEVQLTPADQVSVVLRINY